MAFSADLMAGLSDEVRSTLSSHSLSFAPPCCCTWCFLKPSSSRVFLKSSPCTGSLNLTCISMPPEKSMPQLMPGTPTAPTTMDVADFDDIADAATVLRRLPGWFNDYNEHAPHRALGMLSPREFRRREAA